MYNVYLYVLYNVCIALLVCLVIQFVFADLCPQGIVCVCMFLALGGREREGEGEKVHV